MKIYFGGNDKPLTKEQVDMLTKIKIPKYIMLKGCRNILKPNYAVWKESK